MNKIISIIILLTTLSGCHGLESMKGGDGYIEQESTTVTKSIDGTESTKHETTRVQVSQADNAAKPAKVTVNTSPNGETTTSIDTGIPKDGAATKYAFDLLKVPMYIGGAIVIAGILLCILGKDKTLGIGLCVGGGAVCGGTFLLANYSIFFLWAAIILIAATGLFYIRKYLILHKANAENVSAIQMGRETGAINKEEFDHIADNMQSPSTKKLVQQTKEEEFGSSTDSRE